MPGTLPVPPAAAAVVAAVGSTLPAGTYFVQVTQRNAWGETLPAAESAQLTVLANQGIQITSALLPSATTIRCYLTQVGGASGTEVQFIESTSSPFTISTPPPSNGTPPTRNSAWLPDTDNSFASAFTMYRWLNAGLHMAAHLVGGLTDLSGMPSVAGQPLYVATGEWKSISDIWYDGFPLRFDASGSFFRRNAIKSSVLVSATVSIRSNQVVFEIFWQPVRTAGSTTLSAAMGISDTSAGVVSTSGFLALGPPMFVLIDSEIIAYSSFTATALNNLIRGVGGTTPASHASGATVQELNIWFKGKRLHTQKYIPGNASSILPVPVGWDDVLPLYILHRAREAEQEYSLSKEKLAQFKEGMLEWVRTDRQLGGPRQIGIRGGVDVVPGFGTEFGGVILP